MHITFKSDTSVQFRGFNLTWTEKDFGKLGYCCLNNLMMRISRNNPKNSESFLIYFDQ